MPDVDKEVDDFCRRTGAVRIMDGAYGPRDLRLGGMVKMQYDVALGEYTVRIFSGAESNGGWATAIGTGWTLEEAIGLGLGRLQGAGWRAERNGKQLAEQFGYRELELRADGYAV